MAGQESYTIGQVSKITGVSVATLRWWEEKHGLLSPCRTARGFRLYSDSDVEEVKRIKSKSAEEKAPVRLVQGLLRSEESGHGRAQTKRGKGSSADEHLTGLPVGPGNGTLSAPEAAAVALDDANNSGGDPKGVLAKLRALTGASIAFHTTTELEHVLQLIISNARSIFGIDKCVVFLSNRWAGPDSRSLAKASLSTQSIVEASEIDRAIFQAATRPSTARQRTGGEDARVMATLLGVTGIVSMPLRIRDELLGAIVLGSEHHGIHLTAEEQELAQSFALLSTLAIEKAYQFETVKTSEEKYRRLVERAIDVVFATDGRGRLTFVNSAVVSVLGFPPDELIGHHVLDIVAPCSRSVWLKYLRQAQRGYLPRDSYEIDVVRKDGTTANAEICVTGLYKNGLLSACQGILRDVTEKKRIENEIVRRNEELSALHAITDALPLTLELPGLLDKVLEKVLDVTHLPIGMAFILDEEGGMLHLQAFRESSPGMIKPIPKVKLGAGITGRVAVTGDPIFVEYMREDPRMVIIAPADQELGSMLAVPLKSGCKVIGVMALMSDSRRDFTHHESQLLSTIAYHLGSVVENAWLRDRLSFPAHREAVAVHAQAPGDGGPDGLSAREMDVLRLLANGRSGKEIARLLSISDKTVRTHISKIYQKLHVYDRAQLVLYALRQGLIDVTSDIAHLPGSG